MRTLTKVAALMLVVAIDVGLSAPAVARYRPLTFRELTRRADLVALGTTREVDSATFTFEILGGHPKPASRGQLKTGQLT